MTLYLDTEFNGHGGELISLALVSHRGGHFYGAVKYSTKTHPWVEENVIPHLEIIAEPRDEFRARLRAFMEKHAGEVIIADWPDDFAHLMREMSGASYEESWMMKCTMCLIVSGEIKPKLPHNALSDAVALMEWDLKNDADQQSANSTAESYARTVAALGGCPESS